MVVVLCVVDLHVDVIYELVLTDLHIAPIHLDLLATFVWEFILTSAHQSQATSDRC